jgi:1-deoxy-D-xylulose-5-phosphate synthase
MDEHELRSMMYTAQLPGHGPVVIRYPRGLSEHADWQSPFEELTVGRGRCLREGRGETALVTLGPVGNDALRVAEETGADMYDMRWLKPLDTDLLDKIAARGYRRIVTVEDGVRKGGFGEAVTEYFAEHHPEVVPAVRILAIPDEFVTHGPVAQLKHDCHIDAEAIARALAI